MSLQKVFTKKVWHDDAPPYIDEVEMNARDEAMDQFDDRIIDLDDRVGIIESTVSSGGSSMNVTNLSGWTYKEEMQDEDISFNINWTGASGKGTLIFDLEGKEVDRVEVEQGDVSYLINHELVPDVRNYDAKIYLIDSSGENRIIPLSLKIKTNDTWALAKDDRIAELLQMHKNGEIDIHDYWSVGEIRQVQLSASNRIEIVLWDGTTKKYISAQPAQTVGLVLANEGYSGYLSSENGSPTAFVVCQRKPLANNPLPPGSTPRYCFPVGNANRYNELIQNGTTTLSQGENSYNSNNPLYFVYDAIRAWINREYYSSLPEYIRDAIIPVTYKYTKLTSSIETVDVVGDKVFIPSSANLSGTYVNYVSAEDLVQWQYFKNLSQSELMEIECFDWPGHYNSYNSYWINTRSIPHRNVSPEGYHAYLAKDIRYTTDQWHGQISNLADGIGLMPAFCL